jgi:mRNA interferase RelE/StbE
MQTVIILDPVMKALARIRDRKVRNRLTQAIDELAETPQPHGGKKLSGQDNLYRIRKGDWRISYASEDDQLLIVVIEVARRGDAYQNL